MLAAAPGAWRLGVAIVWWWWCSYGGDRGTVSGRAGGGGAGVHLQTFSALLFCLTNMLSRVAVPDDGHTMSCKQPSSSPAHQPIRSGPQSTPGHPDLPVGRLGAWEPFLVLCRRYCTTCHATGLCFCLCFCLCRRAVPSFV